MFNAIRFFIFIMVLFPLEITANENINNEESENAHNSILVASPAQVVENFYHNYLIAIITNDIEMGDNAIDMYVTQRLKDEVNASDIDWDYYIDAQDICDSWLENIKIEHLEVSGNNAKLHLILGGDTCRSIYQIKLFKESSDWKFDSVVLFERYNKLVK